MANPDTNGTKPPTNLRVAEEEGKECDSCSYYKGDLCTLPQLQGFRLPVDGEWVCDEYSPGGQDRDKSFAGKNLKEAQAEALVRVREHQRKRPGQEPK